MFVETFLLGAACAYAVGAMPLSRLGGLLVRLILPSAGDRLPALARVLIDIAKGFAAVSLFSTVLSPDQAHLGALFAYVGHLYPLCPKCRGGNGIGLLLGTMIAIDPAVGLISLTTWLFTYYVFRYSTLAALAAAVTTPIFASYAELGVDVYFLWLIAIMIFAKLRVSMRLLFTGNEPMVLWKIENP